jgi:hypothetical protein
MHASRIRVKTEDLRRKVAGQVLIDMICEERHERCESTNEGEKNFKQGI